MVPLLNEIPLKIPRIIQIDRPAQLAAEMEGEVKV